MYLHIQRGEFFQVFVYIWGSSLFSKLDETKFVFLQK